jgi:hypothetical protein
MMAEASRAGEQSNRAALVGIVHSTGWLRELSLSAVVWRRRHARAPTRARLAVAKSRVKSAPAGRAVALTLPGVPRAVSCAA